MTQNPELGEMGIPLSCGKPLCSPGDHHPLCKLATPVAAPQPQADARDAERWSEIGKSIERACGELPEDFEITIHLENGAGTVVLLYPNGEECENFPHDDGFAGVVNAATDAAIAAAKEK